MSHKNNKAGSCSHCNSSDVGYYGFTVNAMHYYYECHNCHKFTELHITSIKLILIELIPLIMFVIVVTSLSAMKSIPLFAPLLFLVSVILLVASYNYRWYFGEIIALDKLPDRLIIRAYPQKVRSIIIAIFLAALIGYIGLIVFNILTQYDRY